MKTISKQFVSIGWLIAAFLLLIVSVTSCRKADKTDPPKLPASDSATSILFVGNSLTYTNDLPAILTRIAKDSGVSIRTVSLAYPNYALEYHWNDGDMQKLIATGEYRFVVVQQGPSSQADGRAMLLDYGARIKSLCNQHNAKLAFFMVWPALVNSHTFDGVIQNYSDAAAATNSLLCPVGQVWRNYFLATGDYSYYGPDGFHPSLKGSENAAGIIFRALFR